MTNFKTPTKGRVVVGLTAAVRLGIGGNRGSVISPEARRAGVDAVVARSTARAADLKPTIEELRCSGISSLVGIAKALTAKGISTARGSVAWSAVQVQRVLARIDH